MTLVGSANSQYGKLELGEEGDGQEHQPLAGGLGAAELGQSGTTKQLSRWQKLKLNWRDYLVRSNETSNESVCMNAANRNLVFRSAGSLVPLHCRLRSHCRHYSLYVHPASSRQRWYNTDSGIYLWQSRRFNKGKSRKRVKCRRVQRLRNGLQRVNLESCETRSSSTCCLSVASLLSPILSPFPRIVSSRERLRSLFSGARSAVDLFRERSCFRDDHTLWSVVVK